MTTTLNWDQWRSLYPAMTYADQQAFHSRIHQQYPTQRHYDATYIARAIDETEPTTVVELGGWDGELAEQMLNQYPSIQRWRNVELCREASNAGKDRHPRYEPVDTTDWYWTHTWHADLFIASHVIEHLTTTDLNKTIAATHTNALLLDAPLEDHPLNWRGFTGTHILQTGWQGVTDICNTHGYHLTWAEDHTTDPASGGKARACLYTRGAQ